MSELLDLRGNASSSIVAVREKFQRDGYLVLDPGFPDELLDRVVRDLQPYFFGVEDGIDSHSTKATGGGNSNPRIQDAFRLSPAVRELATFPRILQFIADLYARTPFCFQTLNFPVGTEQLTHSDTIHFNSDPAGFMCGVWVALEDVHTDNGPLRYYPGSHRLAEVTMAEVDAPANLKSYPAYEQYMLRVVADSGLQSEYGIIKRGQAFLWAANLLHGGSPITRLGSTRLSQVSHYFFEGCEYYTPLLSTQKRRHFREPIRLYADRSIEPGRRRRWWQFSKQ